MRKIEDYETELHDYLLDGEATINQAALDLKMPHKELEKAAQAMLWKGELICKLVSQNKLMWSVVRTTA